MGQLGFRSAQVLGKSMLQPGAVMDQAGKDENRQRGDLQKSQGDRIGSIRGLIKGRWVKGVHTSRNVHGKISRC